jgi:hypothetical protein
MLRQETNNPHARVQMAIFYRFALGILFGKLWRRV